MRFLPIVGFVPFPGNVFTYYFKINSIFEIGEKLCFTFKNNKNIGITVEVLQKIKLDQEIKVQFKVLYAVKITGEKELLKIEPKSIKKNIDHVEKETLKNLLTNWDQEEFKNPRNYYFQEIDKSVDRKRFVELVGGCLSRPYKYPYNSKEKIESSINDRLNILMLSSCEEQLAALSTLINVESY